MNNLMMLRKRNLKLFYIVFALTTWWINPTTCADKKLQPVYDDGFLRPAPRKPKAESKLEAPKVVVTEKTKVTISKPVAKPPVQQLPNHEILCKLAAKSQEEQIRYFKDNILPKFKHLVDKGMQTEQELQNTFLLSLKQYKAISDANAQAKVMKSESTEGATSSTSCTQ